MENYLIQIRSESAGSDCSSSAAFINLDDNDDECLLDVLRECDQESKLCCHSEINSPASDFHGFSPQHEKNKIAFLNTLIHNEIEGDIEKDVIEGIVFQSFLTEEDLMEEEKRQQAKRAAAMQSDDGLEILDDGSFSDISSSHAIIPTKTRDITRIKGWRNKHFAGISLCDDSGSSLRNEDDGFGDDFELKSIQDESSEMESVDNLSTPTKMYDNESSNTHSDMYPRSAFGSGQFNINSSEVDDTNAVDNAEESGFSFRSKSAKANLDLKPSSPKFKDNSLRKGFLSDLSFNNKFKGEENIFSSASQSSSTIYRVPENKNTESGVLIRSVSKNRTENKYSNFVYKSKVKLDLLDSLYEKLRSEKDIQNPPETTKSKLTVQKITSSAKSTDSIEPVIRWHVPKDKLMSGNIYDVEVSLGNLETKKEPSLEIFDIHSDHDGLMPQSISKNINSLEKNKSDTDIKNKSLKESTPSSAFQSSTLDQYTTTLDDLHIDFTIPELDAVEGLRGCYEEITLPNPASHKQTIPRNKPKPGKLCRPKAKTVAELKEKLNKLHLANMRATLKSKCSTNDCPLIKKKFSSNKNAGVSKENTKLLTNAKKAHPKKLIDDYGVITYGRETPLMPKLANKSLLNLLETIHQSNKTYEIDSKLGQPCMVVNVGFRRPLYKEIADNISTVVNNQGVIIQSCAEFAASAVQTSPKGPFTVTRFLFPVQDTNLVNLLRYTSDVNTSNEKIKQQKCRRILSEEKPAKSRDGSLDRMSQDSGALLITDIGASKIEPNVFDVVTDIVSYVCHKESLEKLFIDYDPDIPVPAKEECNLVINNGPEVMEKRKKTRLQRQIEILGGTFISVQDDKEETNMALTKNNPGKPQNCSREYCQMGCVCMIETPKIDHCGREMCMFDCHCQSPSNKGFEVKNKICLLPEVVRAQNTSHSKLAPVEREYHQTIIMCKNTITFESKPRKRERKMPSKFRDEILLDYGKEDHFFDVDCRLHVENNEKRGIQSYRKSHDSSIDCYISPRISPLDVFLTQSNNLPVGINECYVRIEKNDILDKYHFSSPRSLKGSREVISQTKHLISSRQQSKLLLGMNKVSRNVALKKTGAKNMKNEHHMFNVQEHCTRTYGTNYYYTLRNMLCKIHTKDMVLYASSGHGSEIDNLVVMESSDDRRYFKEDLDMFNASDIYEESLPSGQGFDNLTEQQSNSGLAIDLIYSLPPEVFEVQGGSDPKEPLVEEKPPADVETSSSRPKNETIVYATLPTTDQECKWWVVEMDVTKFSYLIHVEDKRRLHFEDLLRAMFKVEFGQKTLRIPLNNPSGSFPEKFGVHLIPGHKHLLFFGPYDRNESHGINAMKTIKGKQALPVPFTTKFSDSEGFKSLGIYMAHDRNDPLDSYYINAVWWFSTGKKAIKLPDNGDTDMNNLKTMQTEVNNASQNHENRLQPLNYDERIKESGSESNADTNSNLDPDLVDSLVEQNARGECNNEVNDSEKMSKSQSGEINVEIFLENSSNLSKTGKHTENQSSKKRKRRNKSLLLKKKKTKRPLINHQDTLVDPENEVSLQQASRVTDARVTRQQEMPVWVISDGDDSDEDFFNEIDSNDTNDFEERKKKFVHRINHRSLSIGVPSKSKQSKSDSVHIIPEELIMSKSTSEWCPEHALLSLTPGVGYLTVVEFDLDTIVLQDPEHESVEHEFCDQDSAADWLNNFFADRFLFKEEFTMKWVLMKGSIIKRLQPLDKKLFKLPRMSVEITSSGLTALPTNLEELPRAVNLEKHCEMERIRRSELATLLKTLFNLVDYSPNGDNTIKCSKIRTLETARTMIEAQKMIGCELTNMKFIQLKKSVTLKAQLQRLIEELPDKEKALKTCEFIETSTPQVVKLDRYIQDMVRRERKVVQMIKEAQSKRNIGLSALESLGLNPDEFSMMLMKRSIEDASSCDVRPPKVARKENPPSWDLGPLNVARKENPPSSDVRPPKVASKENQSKKRPKEGMLIRRKKTGATRKQAKPNHVIDLLESDEDDVVIVPSSIEDVVLIPDSPERRDDDLEVLSEKVTKRQTVPKPKKSLPEPLFVDMGPSPLDMEEEVVNLGGSDSLDDMSLSPSLSGSSLSGISNGKEDSPLDNRLIESSSNASQTLAPVAPSIYNRHGSPSATEVVTTSTYSTVATTTTSTVSTPMATSVQLKAQHILGKQPVKAIASKRIIKVSLANGKEAGTLMGDRFLPMTNSLRIGMSGLVKREALTSTSTGSTFIKTLTTGTSLIKVRSKIDMSTKVSPAAVNSGLSNQTNVSNNQSIQCSRVAIYNQANESLIQAIQRRLSTGASVQAENVVTNPVSKVQTLTSGLTVSRTVVSGSTVSTCPSAGVGLSKKVIIRCSRDGFAKKIEQMNVNRLRLKVRAPERAITNTSSSLIPVNSPTLQNVTANRPISSLAPSQSLIRNVSPVRLNLTTGCLRLVNSSAIRPSSGPVSCKTVASPSTTVTSPTTTQTVLKTTTTSPKTTVTSPKNTTTQMMASRMPVSLLKSSPLGASTGNGRNVTAGNSQLKTSTKIARPLISTQRENTVTLHHPSQQLSETREVQFVQKNSVNVETLPKILPKLIPKPSAAS